MRESFGGCLQLGVQSLGMALGMLVMSSQLSTAARVWGFQAVSQALGLAQRVRKASESLWSLIYAQPAQL